MASYTGDNVWYRWNTTSSTNSTTSNYYQVDSDPAWAAWNATAYTTVVTTNGTDDTWHVWNAEAYKAIDTHRDVTGEWTTWIEVSNQEEATRQKETRRARSKRIRGLVSSTRRLEKRRRKILSKQELARRERQAADQKAKDLLLDLIGEEQFKVYEKTGRLIVKGRKHDYLIHARGGGVMRIEKNKLVDLCVHFNDRDLPLEDKVVGFALAIKSDDSEFKRIANDMNWKVNQWRPNKLPEAANF